MTISLAPDGVVLFGLPDTAHAFITGNLSGDPSPDNSGTQRQQLGLFDSSDIRGRWMVVEQTAGMIYPAEVVTTPLYDPKSDISSMALTAKNGETIAVQSRPLRLGVIGRDPATGAWTRDLQCDVIAIRASSSVVGTASVKLIFLDEDYADVGSPGDSWGSSETPPTTWTKRTSWPDIAIPTDAVFVAIKLSWTGTSGALTSGNTCYFRAPWIGFKGNIMQGLEADDFVARYITYV